MNLEQRVAALESLSTTLAAQAQAAKSSARRWRLAAIAGGLALVAGAGVAATNARHVDDVISAESVEIVNRDGDTVIELTSDSTGGMIRLMNNDGDLVGTFEVYESGGYLSIKNTDEDEMAAVHCDQYGGIFAANNADGNRAASLEVDVAGGIVTVRSNEDDTVGALVDIINGGGRVYLNNGEGEEREVKP